MIKSCDNKHSFLSGAHRRCPWCEIDRYRVDNQQFLKERNEALDLTQKKIEEIERLRAECLRLNHEEAEAMSVVLSQEGQIERLRAELADAMAAIDRLHEQRRELEAVRDALREDAERYRWLVHDHDDATSRVKCRAILERLPSMSYSAASTAIDTARKE